MPEKVQPEIVGIISELAQMHREHARALNARISAPGGSGEHDTSIRVTANAAVVTMRDRTTGRDEGTARYRRAGGKALPNIDDGAWMGCGPRTIR